MAPGLFDERVRRPTISFSDLLQKSAGGLLRQRDEYVPGLLRALVIAVDTEGGKLETPDGKPDGAQLLQRVYGPTGGSPVAEYPINPTVGPRNPPNSVRARLLTDDRDQYTDDDHLRTFWPMFHGMANPSAGELVYVMFEDESMLHGLWLTKVPTDEKEETANQILMSQQLAQAVASKRELFPDTQTTSLTNPDHSPIKQPQRLTSLFIDTSRAGVPSDLPNLGVVPVPPPTNWSK